MNAYIKIADWAIDVIQDMEELEQHDLSNTEDSLEQLLQIESF